MNNIIISRSITPILLRRLVLSVLILFFTTFSVLILPIKSTKAAEANWEQVASASFGDNGGQNVQNSSVVFNNKLYIATSSTTPMTAEVSRWDGTSWSKVISSPLSYDSATPSATGPMLWTYELFVFNNYIYAGISDSPTCTRSSDYDNTCKFIWRSVSGDVNSWEKVLFTSQTQFDNLTPYTFWDYLPNHAFSGFAIYDNNLYLGMEPFHTLGDANMRGLVFKSPDGVNWSKAFTGNGIGSSEIIKNLGMFTFKGSLYISLLNSSGNTQIWKKGAGSSTTWAKSGVDNFISTNIHGSVNDKLTAPYPYGIHLSNSNIVVTQAINRTISKRDLLCSTDGISWSIGLNPQDLNVNATAIWGMTQFDNKIFVGLYNNADGAEVWYTDKITSCMSSNTTDWKKANTQNGFVEASNNKGITNLIEYNGSLYAQTYASPYPQPSQLWKFKGLPSNSLTITLPPKQITNPVSLKMSGAVGNATIVCPAIVNNTNTITFSPYSVATKLLDYDGSSATTYDQYCEIVITNFSHLSYDSSQLKNLAKLFVSDAKAMMPPPASNPYILKQLVRPRTGYDFQLTFNPASSYYSKANIDNLYSNALASAVGDYMKINSATSNLELQTQVTLKDTRRSTDDVRWLKTIIPIKRISAEGNIGSGAGSDIGNIVSITNGAIVVAGKTITNLSSSNVKNIANYTWSKDLVTETKNSISTNTKREFSALPASGTTFNLNSVAIQGNTIDNPSDQTKNSFSTPPEGKLWEYNGSLNINNDILFSGRGTIIIKGDLTVNKNISCTTGTQVGFIVYGDINFVHTGNPSVSCGAFLALKNDAGNKGNIDLRQEKSLTMSSILIAESSILIPPITSLTGPILINYDKSFANNPTILFKNILGIISQQGY